MIEFFGFLNKAFYSDKISEYELKYYVDLCYSINHEEYLLDKLKSAIQNESDNEYYYASNYYIEFYEAIKDKISYSNKSKTKIFFEEKISKMKFFNACSYLNDKDYYQAIDHFKECIDDNYMISEKKSKCQYYLVESLYNYGYEKYKEENYSDVKDYLEEALNFLNSNLQIKNWRGIGYYLSIESDLGKTFEKIAVQKWSDYNIDLMEASINYL